MGIFDTGKSAQVGYPNAAAFGYHSLVRELPQHAGGLGSDR